MRTLLHGTPQQGVVRRPFEPFASGEQTKEHTQTPSGAFHSFQPFNIQQISLGGIPPARRKLKPEPSQNPAHPFLLSRSRPLREIQSPWPRRVNEWFSGDPFSPRAPFLLGTSEPLRPGQGSKWMSADLWEHFLRAIFSKRRCL